MYVEQQKADNNIRKRFGSSGIKQEMHLTKWLGAEARNTENGKPVVVHVPTHTPFLNQNGLWSAQLPWLIHFGRPKIRSFTVLWVCDYPWALSTNIFTCGNGCTSSICFQENAKATFPHFRWEIVVTEGKKFWVQLRSVNLICSRDKIWEEVKQLNSKN